MTENVPEEYTFWLNNGRHVRNLHELVKELHHMDDTTFGHHVTDDRNDFANWVLHILKNEQLAKLLEGCKDKKTMERIVAEEIHEEREVKLVVKGASELPKQAPQKQPRAIEKPAPQPVQRAKKRVERAKSVVKPVKKTVAKPKQAVKRAVKKTAPKKHVKPKTVVKKPVIKKGRVTPLTVTTPRHVVKRGKTTRLHVGERPTHSPRRNALPLLTIGSYMVLGIMMGVGIAVVSLALL